MIPYVHFESFELAGLDISVYFLTIGVGVFLGACLAFPMARRLGRSLRTLGELAVMGLAGGFLLAHLVSVIFYYPEQVLRDPWLLLDVFNGLSSVGGFLGAFLGVYLCTRGTKIRLLPYLDCLVYGLTFGLTFGRVGCSLTHDHPGMLTTFAWAVEYPDAVAMQMKLGRFDLGLYECVLLVVLVLWQSHYLWRRPSHGRLLGWTALLYGHVRFYLDFLRVHPGEGPGGVGDPRYAGLTAAQFFCIGFVVLGLVLLRRIPRAAPAASSGEAASQDPKPPAEGEAT